MGIMLRGHGHSEIMQGTKVEAVVKSAARWLISHFASYLLPLTPFIQDPGRASLEISESCGSQVAVDKSHRFHQLSPSLNMST